MYIINNSMDETASILSKSAAQPHDESFQLTWNEILYDGGLATSIPRLSFRWLTIFVCLIGVIGNILAVFTLLRRRMRTLSTYTYLTALCISNTITQICAIIFEVDVFIAPNYLNCCIISIAKALASSAFALSTWITVCFAIDRYIMICFPFIGERKCTCRNAIYAIIICLLISLIYLIPQLLSQECRPLIQFSTDHIKSTGPIYWVSGLSTIGESSAYRLAITLFFNCFLIRIIPFLVICQFDYLLIRTVSHIKRRFRQMNPYEKNRNDETYILVIVISTYLVCIMPSIPFVALFAYDPHEYVRISIYYRLFQHMDEFAKFLTILNSASQCYLYIFFGKRFRRELSSVLCCLCVKYFYMPIPLLSSETDREQFSPDLSAFDDDFEVVLRGEWATDKQHHSIVGIEFSFHYARRASRFTSLKGPLLDFEVDDINVQSNVNLLKRLKNRIGQYLPTFK